MSASKGLALVTGASEGIGAALAGELAARGFDLVLVARREELLEQVAREKVRARGRAARVIARDLGEAAGAEALAAELAQEKLVVDLLVNNAGFAVHGPLAAAEPERLRDLLEVQLGCLVVLTRALLPGMLARGRGGVLNVGSVYCGGAVPYQALYAACKAFLVTFSRSLACELKGSGVRVSLVLPGVTRTGFRRRAGLPEGEGRGMAAEAVARAACDALEAGRLQVTPGMLNKLYVAAQKLLPWRLVAGLTTRVNERRGLGRH